MNKNLVKVATYMSLMMTGDINIYVDKIHLSDENEVINLRGVGILKRLEDISDVVYINKTGTGGWIFYIRNLAIYLKMRHTYVGYVALYPITEIEVNRKLSLSHLKERLNKIR